MPKNLDPMEGASPYYKELYKRRFVNDFNDKENAIPTGGKSVMNSGLMDYFQKRQLEIYPLELFSVNYQDIFTPTIGEYLQFKTNPAMNKGTAVFTSGFWREGICQKHKKMILLGERFLLLKT
ncbi:uncharacterized protein [Mytilus edulis]|uniref:uncharacterized protein n=1 Tax=Mytilus edulis TaxID=6550 RepID=UPI0039EF7297